MTSADLVRADQQMMLIVGTFVAAQQDPAIWERLVDRMFDGWASESANDAAIRSTAANQAIVALGRLATGRAAQPDMDAAAADNDAKPTPDPSGRPATPV